MTTISNPYRVVLTEMDTEDIEEKNVILWNRLQQDAKSSDAITNVDIVVFQDDCNDYVCLLEQNRDLVEWLENVGKTLVDMQHVTIRTEDSEDHPGVWSTVPGPMFPVAALKGLLTARASTLQSITLEWLPLAGDRSDYEDTFAKLKEIHNLKSFNLESHDCLKSMEVYDIDDWEEEKYWGNDTLIRTLNEMDSIEEIILGHGRFSKEALVELSTTGNKYKRPSLSLNLNYMPVDPAMLCGQNSRLAKLSTVYIENGSNMPIHEFMTSILGALAQNTSLVELEVWDYCLKKEEVDLHQQEWNAKLFALFTEHNNKTLAKFRVGHPAVAPVEWNDMVAFLLKLNGIAGLHDLMNNNVEDRMSWVNMIHQQQQDTSVIFYLLSNNPTILQHHHDDQAVPIKKKKKKKDDTDGKDSVLLALVGSNNKKRKLN